MNDNRRGGGGGDGGEAAPYSYQERVLWMPSGGKAGQAAAVRLEFLAEWDTGKVGGVHPFSQIQQRLFPPPAVDGDEFSDARFQISSRAVSEYPADAMHEIPTLASSKDQAEIRISGPSGFWILLECACPHRDPPASIATDCCDSGTGTAASQQWMERWIRERLITTPVSNDLVRWDAVSKSQKQLILPTNGQGWSADALRQTFQAMRLPNSSFMGRSAMDWSNTLVSSDARSKTMWWHLRRRNGRQYSFGFGLEFTVSSPQSIEQERSYVESLVEDAKMNPSPVSMTMGVGPRNFYRVFPDASLSSPVDVIFDPPEGNSNPETTPWLKVEQVLRRPTMQGAGRLESWIEADTRIGHCDGPMLSYRQVLPPFVAPSWQSLDAVTMHDDRSQPPMKKVKWLDGGTSVLELQFPLTQIDDGKFSAVVSLELSPVFLTIDDFPGDPNRGRELPPAVVRCEAARERHQSHEVFSSSLLVMPPVPDMSMPFNVLSMTCSLFAYLIGTILILTLKKGSENVVFKLYPERKPKSLYERVKDRVRR